MNFKEIVSVMRNKNTKSITECFELENDMLKKCIICKHFLSSQKWSLLLEKSIIQKFNMKKNKTIYGDATTISNKLVEIKVSLGGNKQYNFVQLRPNHHVDYYLFLIYDIQIGELGSIHWFLLSHTDINQLICQYGKYAHGSKKILGDITLESVAHNNFEYALRPTRKSKLWKVLFTFEKSFDEIYNILNKN